MQLDNYQTILDIPETNLKTGRTNSTNKSIEEATSKKLGNMEMIMAAVVGGANVTRGERETSTQGSKLEKMDSHSN